MSFFISSAMAAPTSAAAHPEGGFSIIMMIAIFVLFYFMLIRPQSKRAKEQRNLIESIKKGDEVITVGGLLGKVSSLDEQYIKLEIADGVILTLQRGSVNTILPKGTIKSL
jgi:preprotein translocase subunit YajC